MIYINKQSILGLMDLMLQLWGLGKAVTLVGWLKHGPKLVHGEQTGNARLALV